jgi:hypothetical protein
MSPNPLLQQTKSRLGGGFALFGAALQERLSLAKRGKREKWIDFPLSPVYSRKARHGRWSGDGRENL